MSNYVDVLAVMDAAAAEAICRAKGARPSTGLADSQCAAMHEARAAVAELIEAAQALPSPRGAQVITFEGADYVLLAPEDHEALCNALARVTGGAE